jgi:hypothetical protein
MRQHREGEAKSSKSFLVFSKKNNKASAAVLKKRGAPPDAASSSLVFRLAGSSGRACCVRHAA